jgi:hypothetical protein
MNMDDNSSKSELVSYTITINYQHSNSINMKNAGCIPS